jgi:sugar phosphate isomerase/epimerase
MKLGVAGLLPEWQKIDIAAAQKVRAAGFKGASIFFQRPLEAGMKEISRLKQALDAAGLETAQANGWYECLVNPDDDLRAASVKGLQALVGLGQQLGAPTVYVRPGSLNPGGHWWPHPANHTPAVFDRLVGSLKLVSATAQTAGMVLAIEGHVLSPLDSAMQVRHLLDAVASPALKFNLDAVNFIGSVRDVHNPTPFINELLNLLGQDIVAAHIKDCALEDELVLHIKEVVVGTGVIDHTWLLGKLQAINPQMYCIIEHLPDELVPQARSGLLAAAAKINLSLEY